MGAPVRIVSCLAGLAAAVALTGCGASGGSLLSSDSASQLRADLTQAQTALAAGNCPSAESEINRFRDDVSQLQGVNSTLVSMLSQGASTINGLAANRCGNGSGSTTTSSHTTSTASVTSTTATLTVTTATTASETTPGTSTGSGSGGVAPTTVTTPTTPTGTGTGTPPATPTQTTPASGGTGLDGSSGAAGGGAGQ